MSICKRFGISDIPWIVGELTSHPTMNDCIAVFIESEVPSENANSIAITGLMDDPDSERLKKTYADSQLIAAAPEMLESLIDQWMFIEDYLACNASSMGKYDYQDFVEKQNAIVKIIEKATGKPWEEIKGLIHE